MEIPSSVGWDIEAYAHKIIRRNEPFSERTDSLLTDQVEGVYITDISCENQAENYLVSLAWQSHLLQHGSEDN